MYCYYCDSLLDEPKDICPNCKRNIQGATQGFDKHCVACSCRIPDDALFCPFCGKNNQHDVNLNDAKMIEEEIKQTTYKSMKANSKIVEAFTCKMCTEKFTIGDEIVKCENCENYYHQKCWNSFGCCNQSQCKETVKKCPSCNQEIKESAVKCWHCGYYLDSSVNPAKPIVLEEDLNVGLKILSLCIPLAGAIMYFNYKGSEPKKATSACTFALIGLGVGLFLRIISSMMK